MIEFLLQDVKDMDMVLLITHFTISLCLCTQESFSANLESFFPAYRKLCKVCDVKPRSCNYENCIALLDDVKKDEDFIPEVEHYYSLSVNNPLIVFGRIDGSNPNKYTRDGFMYFLHEHFPTFTELINIAQGKSPNLPFVEFIKTYYSN